MGTYELTPEECAALDALLPMTERSGNLRDDLAAAVGIAVQRRRDCTQNALTVIDALFHERWRADAQP